MRARIAPLLGKELAHMKHEAKTELVFSKRRTFFHCFSTPHFFALSLSRSLSLSLCLSDTSFNLSLYTLLRVYKFRSGLPQVKSSALHFHTPLATPEVVGQAKKSACSPRCHSLGPCEVTFTMIRLRLTEVMSDNNRNKGIERL